MNQHYHSTFGAVTESRHIFIESGLLHFFEEHRRVSGREAENIRILEVGFGTGLNALLTVEEAESRLFHVDYTAIEPFPVDVHLWQALNYPLLQDDTGQAGRFARIHRAPPDETSVISPFFTLHKHHGPLETFEGKPGSFDLVYFDAFSPEAQPELWTSSIFQKLSDLMAAGGVLMTYSVKGTVVRALKESGFLAEKLAGPPGKRHILRATKK